ncbi:melanoregulin isoform X2 [Paramormyrops kingsleyae]|uniref:melanoregulin isoform X2 n=1 Tax=Paramormyrops kingsleyae TaxID=1676925 RepID=UPI003B96A878
MGAAFRRFCAHFCCCCCCADDEPEEKNPLLSETLLYFDREAKKRRDQETNLWSEPGDHSHSERDDDRELYNLLQKRSRMRRGSQGNAQRALSELYLLITSNDNAHPDGLFIISGDFNQADFRSVYPKHHQHVSCPTCGANTLDHCYTGHRGAFRSLPRAHLGRSDHTAVLLLPVYKQKLKREEPVMRMVQRWTHVAEDKLQDCFDCVDWDIFRDSSSDLDEYASGH